MFGPTENNTRRKSSLLFGIWHCFPHAFCSHECAYCVDLEICKLHSVYLIFAQTQMCGVKNRNIKVQILQLQNERIGAE